MNFHLLKIEDISGAVWWVNPSHIAAIGPTGQGGESTRIAMVGGGALDLFLPQDAVLEQLQEGVREFLNGETHPLTTPKG